MDDIGDALSQIPDPLDRFLRALQAMSIATRAGARIQEAKPQVLTDERMAELDRAHADTVEFTEKALAEAKRALQSYVDQRIAAALGELSKKLTELTT
jgi:hypothetical protein